MLSAVSRTISMDRVLAIEDLGIAFDRIITLDIFYHIS